MVSILEKVRQHTAAQERKQAEETAKKQSAVKMSQRSLLERLEEKTFFVNPSSIRFDSSVGFPTTEAGESLVEIIKNIDQNSSFTEQDFNKLAGFNVRPLPANFNNLDVIKQNIVLEDRKKSIRAEKARIATLRNDVVESLNLEQQGLKPTGDTLRILRENIAQQNKQPLTILSALENLSRGGRLVRGTIASLFSKDINARDVLKATLTQNIAYSKDFDGKQLLEKAGFRTRSLSELFPKLFSESGEGIKLKRGGLWDITGQGVAGFVLDVYTDPVFWLTGGAAVRSIPLYAAGKQFSANELGKIVVKLNTKGSKEYVNLVNDILKKAGTANIKMSNRTAELKASEQLFEKYGKNFAKGQHLIDKGGLGLKIPFSAHEPLKLIEGDKVRNLVNHLISAVPDPIRQSLHKVKNDLVDLGHAIFGGTGALIKNPKIKEIYGETISLIKAAQNDDFVAFTKILSNAKKSGLPDSDVSKIFLQRVTNNLDTIAQRKQLLKQELLQAAPMSAKQAIHAADDLEKIIGIGKQLEKTGQIKNFTGMIKKSYTEVFKKNYRINLITDPTLQHLEAAKTFNQNLDNLLESAFKDFADLHPSYIYEGRFANYITGLNLNKAFETIGGIDMHSAKAVAAAINSLKRTKGVNLENMAKLIKDHVANNNPTALANLNTEIMKGLYSNSAALRVATGRRLLANYLDDLYSHIPANQKVPITLIKGQKPALVPPVIKEQLTKELSRGSSSLNQEFTKWFRALGVEATTNIWKQAVTVLWPAFAVRNAVGEFINSFADRGLSVFLNHGDTIKLTIPHIRKNMVIKDIYGKVLGTGDEIWSKMRQKGVVDAAIRVDLFDDATDLLMTASYPGAKLQRALANNFVIKNLGFTPTQYIENYFRINTYLHTLRKTGSFEQAAHVTDMFHVNYRTVLSPFERQIVKRILPFYTFSKRNMMIQMRNWLTNPGYSKLPPDLIRAASDDLLEEDVQSLPQWLLGRFIIKTGVDKDGQSQYTIFSGLPTEEAFGRFFTRDINGNLRFSDILLKSIGGLLNPAIKFPVEHLMDHSLFFGGKIRGDGTEIVYDKVPDIIQKIIIKLDEIAPDSSKALRTLLDIQGPKFNKYSGKTEFSMNPTVLHMLQNMPISRLISEASRLSDSDVSKLQSLTQYLTNVSFQNIDTPTRIEVQERGTRASLIERLKKHTELAKNLAAEQGIAAPERPTMESSGIATLAKVLQQMNKEKKTKITGP